MYAGLWMFAWDLADEGIDRVMQWASDSGVNALQIAAAYHAGWFLHPHNPRHRAYMPEDGCVYFQPTETLYENTALKPKVAAVCAQTDWLREAGRRAGRYNLKLVSWTVCAHNSRLGLKHPGCTVRNCFGDSYPHALCPANDDVRKYLAALCSDLAASLPLEAVQLEAPGYLGLAHGHHHERDLTVFSPFEQTLMGFCFCPSCTRKAEDRQVDIARIRAAVRAVLEGAMASAPARPIGHPQSLLQFAQTLPGLADYQAFRAHIEASLIHEIRAAMAPSASKLSLLGGYDPLVADVVDIFYCGAYGQGPGDVLTATRAAKTALDARHELYVGIRLGLNSVKDQGELCEIVQAVQEGGGDGVLFYNYSESPMTTLNWIKPALASVR